MLEVAHERSVRRIVAEVIERPRGSLYLCVGRSAEVRAEVEAAIRERVPEMAHASVTLREDEGPWWRIFQARDAIDRPDGEVLVSVAGLGEMGEEARGRVLGHLNLGREERVVHQLHMLLWVGALDGLERFRTGASDLWGHRSGVELFLSSEDFEVAFDGLGPEEVPKSLEAQLQATEEELVRLPSPYRRIQLVAKKTTLLDELGRWDEALHAAEHAQYLVESRKLPPHQRTDAYARVVQAMGNVLAHSRGHEEALKYVMRAESKVETDPILQFATQNQLALLFKNSGHTVESLESAQRTLSIIPRLWVQVTTGRATILVGRADLFAQLGATDNTLSDIVAATEEIERVRTRSEEDGDRRAVVLSGVYRLQANVCAQRGNLVGVLEYVHRRTMFLAAIGAQRYIGDALEAAANAYFSLGLVEDARRFAERAIDVLSNRRGQVAWWTQWLGACDVAEGNVAAGMRRYDSAVSLYKSAASEGEGHFWRIFSLRNAAALLIYQVAPISDPNLSFDQADVLLNVAETAATEAASPEQQALTTQTRARLAEARKDWAAAEAHHLTVLAWAQANLGPFKRAEVLLDLARVVRERSDLPRALDYADRARREVEIDPPEYQNRFTAIAAAREIARIHKAGGDLAAAHASLESAISVAQGDGLRLREREILIDLAELPPAPGAPDRRVDYAQRARTIAQDAAFPVDEAEATFVLADLALQAGQPRRAKALFEQVAWIVDRIGPRPLRERATRLRAALDA